MYPCYFKTASEFKNKIQNGEEEFLSKKRNRSEKELTKESKKGNNDKVAASKEKRKKLSDNKNKESNCK